MPLQKALTCVLLVLVGGCANMNVSHVSDKDLTTKGLRYYLPKPYLQATPQADGTISVDVIFLPDKSHEYAIDTSSYLSAYTFQASRDEKGLLTALEFKASTSAVGQQLASSASSYATQSYNIKAAAAVAQQTQVNSAQSALDTARSAFASATATLTSDQAHAAAQSTLTVDYAALASAQAKLDIAQEALQRAQTTQQQVSTAVAAGSPIATAAPAIGTAFQQPTWNAPSTYNLPQQFAPVLYAINDDGKTVALVAVKAKLSHTPDAKDFQKGVAPEAQPVFNTTSRALGPPSLFPLSQTQPTKSKQATFVFDRPVKAVLKVGSSVSTDATPPVPQQATPQLSGDLKTVTVDTTGMSAGQYNVTVAYTYVVDPAGQVMSAVKQVKLAITP